MKNNLYFGAGWCSRIQTQSQDIFHSSLNFLTIWKHDSVKIFQVSYL